MGAALAYECCQSSGSRSHVPPIPELRSVPPHAGTGSNVVELDGRDLPVLREESAVTIAATFPAGSPLHVSHVRSWAGEVLAERWGEDGAFAAEVAVSEVVTNASRHGCGTIRVSLVVGDGELVADVADESPQLPKIRHASDTDVSGRGLPMIISLGGKLAVLHAEIGKIVRLRIAREQPKPTDLLAVWADDDV